MALVSIIVPVYNAEKFINETVNCILAQTLTDWELLLVENGSTDNTPEILKTFTDERIKVINAEKNIGAAGARNKGMELSTGRFVCYIDADDLWKPEKLEKQVEFMQKKDVAFCFTGYEFADHNGTPLGTVVNVPEVLKYKKALRNTTIFTSTVMFDTDKIDRAQLMMPSIPSEDTALWWKVLRSGFDAYGLNETLVYYRRPGKSLSSNKFIACKRIWNLYRKQEKLNIFASSINFAGWAMRAVLRRI